MSAAIQITFLGMARCETVEQQIMRWVTKLDRSFGRIVRCSTWIEQPHHHAQKGNTWRVRIELSVPGDTLVVSRDPAEHENVYAAVADAFQAARRQLQHYKPHRERAVLAPAHR